MSDDAGSEITCRGLVELVTDYLENRLPGSKRARLERHLGACPGCCAYVAQMRALVRAAGRIPREDLSPADRADLLAMFREWRRE